MAAVIMPVALGVKVSGLATHMSSILRLVFSDDITDITFLH